MAKGYCTAMWLDEVKLSVVNEQDVVNPDECHEGKDNRSDGQTRKRTKPEY